MAWDILQSNSTPATGTAVSSVACTYASNVLGTTKLVAYVATSTQTGTTDEVATVKDAAGNSWTLLGRQAQGNPNVLCDVSAWGLDTPAGDAGTKPTLTATLSGGTAEMGMLIQEISGLNPGNTLADMIDGTLASLGGNGGSATGSPAYTSTALNELLISVYGDDGGPETWTVPAGLTADAKSVNGSSYSNIAVASGNSTDGAETASWGLSGSPADWGTLLFAFRLAPSTVTGTGSAALPSAAQAGSGTATPPPVTGTGSAALPTAAMSGTSAAAKLLMSLASVAGTDPAGNAYLAGVSVGEPGSQQAQLTVAGGAGKLRFPSGLAGEDLTAGADVIVGGASPAQYIQLVVGSATVGNTSQVYEEWNSANADGSGDANWNLLFADKAGNVWEPMRVDSRMTGWQVMTLQNSFTDGEFGPAYQMMAPSGMLAFHGQLILPATFNGVVFTTLPAAFWPAFGSGVSVRWPVSCQSSTSVAGYCQLGSDGTVTLWGAGFASGDLVDITGITFIA